MKIILEEKDLRFVENINKDIEEVGLNNIPLYVNECDRNYYINFSCIDIAKANRFVLMLMTSDQETREMIEDTFGIRVNSLNYCHGDNRVAELKEYLQEFINRLDQM